jgi:hypothetical protein
VRNELRAITDGLKDVLSEHFDPHSLLLKQIERTSPLAVLQKARLPHDTRVIAKRKA